MAKDKQAREIQDLLSKRDFIRAEGLLASRLSENPRDPDAYYLQGVSHYFQGKLGPTIKSLREALELDPKHTDAAICLSVLYNDVGKYDEAKRVFEVANQSVAKPKPGEDWGVDRKFAVKHLELADLYFRYRRYDEAIEEYSKATLLDPTDLEIRMRRAKALAKKGFLTRAFQELQQLKRENARFIPARIQLGLLHYAQGNILDAELEWESALSLEAESREAKTYLEMLRHGRPIKAT